MFMNSRPTNLRCWTTEGIWCGKRGGNYSNADDDDDIGDDVDDIGNGDRCFCSNDHDLMDYMEEIAQVVSINCSVSANPSNDLVFRFQQFVNICSSRRS